MFWLIGVCMFIIKNNSEMLLRFFFSQDCENPGSSKKQQQQQQLLRQWLKIVNILIFSCFNFYFLSYFKSL